MCTRFVHITLVSVVTVGLHEGLNGGVHMLVVGQNLITLSVVGKLQLIVLSLVGNVFLVLSVVSNIF